MDGPQFVNDKPRVSDHKKSSDPLPKSVASIESIERETRRLGQHVYALGEVVAEMARVSRVYQSLPEGPEPPLPGFERKRHADQQAQGRFASEEPAPAAPIQLTFSRLEMRVGEFDRALSALEERLAPVLAQTPAGTHGNTSEAAPQSGTSSIHAFGMMLSDRVFSYELRVRNLLARLEL